MRSLLELALLASIVAPVPLAPAQAKPAPIESAQATGFPGTPVGHRPKVEIPWNRFYNYAEVYAQQTRALAF